MYCVRMHSFLTKKCCQWCGWLRQLILCTDAYFVIVINSLWLTSFLLLQGHICTFLVSIKETTIFNPSVVFFLLRDISLQL